MNLPAGFVMKTPEGGDRIVTWPFSPHLLHTKSDPGNYRSLVGKRLGPYEILSLIGRGGMSEVYRVRDARLDRNDALKILPMEVASDPARIRRFVREAHAASALSHPNIATIYEIGESESVHWIAMELVEGETLAQRLTGRSHRSV